MCMEALMFSSLITLEEAVLARLAPAILNRWRRMQANESNKCQMNYGSVKL